MLKSFVYFKKQTKMMLTIYTQFNLVYLCFKLKNSSCLLQYNFWQKRFFYCRPTPTNPPPQPFIHLSRRQYMNTVYHSEGVYESRAREVYLNIFCFIKWNSCLSIKLFWHFKNTPLNAPFLNLKNVSLRLVGWVDGWIDGRVGCDIWPPSIFIIIRYVIKHVVLIPNILESYLQIFYEELWSI